MRVGGAPASSPARQVDVAEPITVVAPPDDYVSRGGHKLAAALDAFRIEVAGKNALDIGASTGGFTDCLLQRGAAHVVAVDVGRAQLAWSLRNDARVTVRERTDVRAYGNERGELGDPVPGVCTVDVSFISLRTVAPALAACTDDSTDLVVLVKPQFEAGRARIGKGGVVRDAGVHRDVLHEVVDGLADRGLGAIALVVSPLRGADGNCEFFAHVRRGRSRIGDVDVERVVTDQNSAP